MLCRNTIRTGRDITVAITTRGTMCARAIMRLGTTIMGHGVITTIVDRKPRLGGVFFCATMQGRLRACERYARSCSTRSTILRSSAVSGVCGATGSPTA